MNKIKNVPLRFSGIARVRQTNLKCVFPNTCERSPFLVANVAESVEIFLRCLEWIISIANMDGLLSEVKKQRLVGVVIIQNFVSLASEQICAISPCFIIHNL